MEIAKAMGTLRERLKADKDYYYGWQANIAMAYQDQALRSGTRDSVRTLQSVSNEAAKNFLNMLIST